MSDEILPQPTEVEAPEGTPAPADEIVLEGAEPAAAEPATEDAVSAEPAPAPLPSQHEMFDRLTRAEMRSRELEERLNRIGPPSREPAIPDRPPKPIEQLSSAQDIVEYKEWQRARDREELRRLSAVEGAATASEQHARGLLSAQAVGAGYDYDSMTARHIVPLEQQNPGLRSVFQSMDNPALGRYVLAFVLETMGKMNNDPVKAIKDIRAAMDGRPKAQQQLTEKINQSARAAAQQARLKASRPSPAKRTITGDQIDRMTPEEFERTFRIH